MLREQTPHRDLVSEARKLIIMSQGIYSDKLNSTNELDKANDDYITAKLRWSVNNTDETMIDLIGTWARLNKLFRDIEAKYGRKS